MIYIPVDEGYAFDYLAILNVKRRRNLIPPEPFQEFASALSKQLPNFQDVLVSEEYQKIFELNNSIFDYVDQAQKDQIKASVVAKANHQRFVLKQQLQRKWFNSVSAEVKTTA